MQKITNKSDSAYKTIGEIAKAAADGGADAICAINTMGPEKHEAHGHPILSNQKGGLSGKGILPTALQCVRDIRNSVDCPIIACGGISSAANVRNFQEAGASIIGVGSALIGMTTDQIAEYFTKLSDDLENGTDNCEKLVRYDIDMNFKPVTLVENKKITEDICILTFDCKINGHLCKFDYNDHEKYDWAKVVTNKIGLEEYKNNLVSSSFVLCPEGNGIDTHRVWEALYSGSIPVVKNRTAFKSFDKLPILFVDSFYDVTAETLSNYLNNLKSYDFKKIDFNYWSDYLKSDLNKSEEAITVQVNTTLNTLFQYRKSSYKRYLKLKNGFFRIIYRFKNKYQIHFKKIN